MFVKFFQQDHIANILAWELKLLFCQPCKFYEKQVTDCITVCVFDFRDFPSSWRLLLKTFYILTGEMPTWEDGAAWPWCSLMMTFHMGFVGGDFGTVLKSVKTCSKDQWKCLQLPFIGIQEMVTWTSRKITIALELNGLPVQEKCNLTQKWLCKSATFFLIQKCWPT